ncbi:MAG: gamma-glutamyltransferase, partial [Polyangiaceae bacterium]|nr:gamma-glutamyltransferase [Polyangiaceae bacterium]
MIAQGAKDSRAVGVPGTPAGLQAMHQELGNLPWEALVKPAQQLAAEGFVLGSRQSKTIRWAQQRLSRDPRTKETWLPRGRVPLAGKTIKLPALARALAELAGGARNHFYKGAVAEDLIESTQGAIRQIDLDSYQPYWRMPLRLDYLGNPIWTMPAPSAGGVALAQNLLILQATQAQTKPSDSIERLQLIAEASRRAQVERRLFVLAPERLSNEDQKKARQRWLSPLTWLEKHPIQPGQATASSSLSKDYQASLRELEHTTHLSVIDETGMAVSCTLTLSGSFGIGRQTQTFGIFLNNSVASFSSVGTNVPAAGKRTTSSMAPTIMGGYAIPFPLSEKKEKTKNTIFILGSPGGDTIPSTLTQLILHLVDGESLERAVLAPRFHQAFVPDAIRTERFARLPKSQLHRLKSWGYHLGQSRATIGDANIASRRDGQNFALADPREGGWAAKAE